MEKENTIQKIKNIGLNIPQQLDALIHEASDLEASDIHIDPGERCLSVRFRADGLLYLVHELPMEVHTEMIARLKVLARLRTDVHTIPHDGRFRFGECDIRISIVPTQYGENAVLRLLPINTEPLRLTELGFSDEDRLRIERAMSNPHGMILTTGPTGSGKTSTQYSLISGLDVSERAVVTLEDPVERVLAGVRQIPVNPKHGLTFASGLRAVLRQDPDVIMVGEIRDGETADIAIHAALTGHLLVSTLHTNSAVDTLPRLIDMGVEPYLVASTLEIVINQRLVRTICTQCRGDKCADCRQSGFRGRTVIAEVLPIDAKLRSYIMRRLSRDDLLKYMHSAGIQTIHEHGLEKVRSGVTTEDEIRRVLYNI